jgi:steroid delta-isomerase-like uncharacterized protein
VHQHFADGKHVTHPNVRLIETWVSLMNAQDFGTIRRLYTAAAVVEDVAMGTKCSGHEEIERFYREIIEGFPDYHVTIHGAVADVDRGGVEFNFSGTHRGAAWGLPPTYKAMDIRGATMMQFSGDRIAIQHDYWSLPQFYEQLGLPLP